jgi:hypothetical protein
MIKTENKYFYFDQPKIHSLKQFIKDVLHIPFLMYYKSLLNHHKPKTIEQKKYKVSICAIFKNEAMYLKEWIEYHRIIGIEHFFLYNNNSEDDYMSVLEPYIKDDVVTLVQWPHNQAQMQAYKDGVEQFSKETEWLSFIDIDEFVVPVTNENIYDFLKPFQKNRPVVLAYWKMFGTSGKIARDLNNLVTEDLTVTWDKFSDMGKLFYNTAYELDLTEVHSTAIHHYCWGKLGKKYLPPVNIFNKICVYSKNPVPSKTGLDFPLQINHYFSKTYDEYKQKKSKGDVYFKINPHDEEYFFKHEFRNTECDYKIFKYLIKLKLALKKDR